MQTIDEQIESLLDSSSLREICERFSLKLYQRKLFLESGAFASCALSLNLPKPIYKTELENGKRSFY